MAIYYIYILYWYVFYVTCYHTYVGAVFLDKAFFGAGNGSILLDDVVCSGSEDTILQCTHNSFEFHDCGHDEDVGVHCSESGKIYLLV